MNLKGKEHIACKTIKMIKAMLHKEKSVPIRLKYIDDLVMPNSEPVGMTTTTSAIMNQDNSEKDRQSNTESVTVPTDDTGGNRLRSRLRKPPKSLSKDFFW
jgi:endo-1,4-beta-D-glucanase Y